MSLANEIQGQAERLTRAICGQVDANLFESIVSLFNRGVLVHYVQRPEFRSEIDPGNFNLTFKAASGVRFEGRERLIDAEAKIKELRELIRQKDAVLKLHHKWHLDIGEVDLAVSETEKVTIDLSLEYKDSGLCEATREAMELKEGDNVSKQK